MLFSHLHSVDIMKTLKEFHEAKMLKNTTLYGNG